MFAHDDTPSRIEHGIVANDRALPNLQIIRSPDLCPVMNHHMFFCLETQETVEHQSQ